MTEKPRGIDAPEARRAPLASALALLLLMAACGGSSTPTGLPPTTPPGSARSVLLVTIDTLRADRLGCAGHEGAGTPNLDRLARDGVRFLQARTPVPITLPAHASLFTGLYPASHGVLDNRPDPLPAGVPTLQDRLREAGFHTAAFVSGEPLREGCGLERGFDVYDFTPGPRHFPLELAERPSSETVRAAIAWAREGHPRQDRSFLWVHLFDPHAPYAPRPPFDTRHPGDPYQGEVAQADDAVGFLLAGLDTCGWLQGAAVILTADHGEGLGEHGEATHGYFLWDTTLRIPLILHGAGLPAGWKGTSRRELASLVDLPATVASLLGLGGAIPQGSGHSLLDLTQGPEAVSYAATWMPYLHFRWSPLRAIHKGRWKLIRAGERDHVVAEIQGQEEEVPDFLAASALDLVQALEDFEENLPPPPASSPSTFLPALPGYLGTGARYPGQEPVSGDPLKDPFDHTRWIEDLRHAEELCARGGHEQALEELESLRGLDPRNPAVAYWRGRALRELARTASDPRTWLEAARASFHEAARLSGGSTDATNLEVWCLLRLGRLETAHDLLQRMIRDGQADAQTHELLGMLLTGTPRELGTPRNPFLDRAAGMAQLETSLRLDPSGERVRRRLAELGQDGPR